MTDKKIQCPVCYGQGRVVTPEQAMAELTGNATPGMTSKCPACQGTGTVDTERKRVVKVDYDDLQALIDGGYIEVIKADGQIKIGRLTSKAFDEVDGVTG